jgi:choline dehydrogenase-like flavoprotein
MNKLFRNITVPKTAIRQHVVALINSAKWNVERQLLNLSLNLENDLAHRNRKRSGDGTHWFIAEEAVLIDVLASLLVPSDENTPGANEMDVMGPSAAKVLDILISGSSWRQFLYAKGLIAFDKLAERTYKSKFTELEVPRQLELLKFLEKSIANRPKISSPMSKLRKNILMLQQLREGSHPAIELFPMLVMDVMQAFYTSEVSWIWLGYDGPPMPHGYTELQNPRPRKGTAGSETVRELAAAGFGSAVPNISLNKDAIDVIVIGSGAGGGVVVKELAEAGLSVVVLEAGSRFNPFIDYLTDRTDFESRAESVFDPDDYRRDLYTFDGSDRFNYNRAKGVGGSTLKYVAVSPRFHETDFRVRTEDGVADDWPIRYQDLEPFYTRVEYELGVSGPTGSEANPFDPPRSKPYPTPPHRFNLASLAIKRGADRLGLHMVREPAAIPTIEWNGRPACINAGTCKMGCAITAKSSMDVTYLRTAEKSGRVEIRSTSMAHRITVAPDGKARSVVYFDREGREHEIKARAIVLAGNAVETPRLLLMSGSSQFPDGLANSSGLVGRYFMEHLYVVASGVFSERLDPWRGTPTGGMIQDYYATNKTNAFARGWTILVANGGNWPLSIAVQVPGWGNDHKRRTEKLFAHTVRLCSVGEQLPDIRNQVTLDPMVKDQFGLPVPRLTNLPRENDRAMIKAIQASLKEILDAAGATEILRNEYRPGESAHYFGTCRMGSDPKRSVVNAWGRTHDIPNLFIADGSVFVTGAAVNPALTISALATRTAMGMVEAFRRGEL